jgi:AraC-like DNA-binding protein
MAFQVSHVLGIEAEADKHRKKLLLLFPKVSSQLAVELAADISALDFVPLKERRDYLKNSLALYIKRKDLFFISLINYFLGILENKDKKLSYHYFLNSYLTAKKGNLGSIAELYGVAGLSSVLMEQKKYSEAFDLLSKRKDLISTVSDLNLKELYFKNYAKSAAVLEYKNDIEWATERYQSLVYNDDGQQVKARSQLVELIEKYNNQEIEEQRSFWRSILFSIVSLILICTMILIAYRKYKTSKLSLKERPIDTEQKVFVIPDKTEKEIIEKLNRFESSGKFTKGNISLKSLALQLDTNPRYLSEIINKHKDSNFNTYINNLRIEYILKKLNENEEYRKYKVSYLAEESGFSSHSLFTTTFKNKVGRSPIEYIKNIEENK